MRHQGGARKQQHHETLAEACIGSYIEEPDFTEWSYALKRKLATLANLTGMRGVYLVAAELAGRGFIVSPTSRSAIAADLLVTDQRCKRSYSVQVKANASRGKSWLVGKHAGILKSDTLVYVFVHIPETGSPTFYVVPSADLAKAIRKSKGSMPGIGRAFLNRYKDDWWPFGRP